MFIRKIKIYNFRIYKNIEFNFSDNRLILLSGSNGFGKTTVMDAIEWCLTGKITRLYGQYESRNTSITEKNRIENKKGLLKNAECPEHDKVLVEIEMLIDDEVVKVYREQKEDGILNASLFGFKGNISKEIKAKFYKYINEDLFYNYHVCDIYKAVKFLDYSRQNIKNLFTDFTKPYSMANDTIAMLNKYIEYSENKLKELESKYRSIDEIIELEKSIETVKTNIRILEYPKVVFCEKENLNIELLDTEKLKLQLQLINTCGYNYVDKILNDLIKYYELNEKHKRIYKILTIVENNIDTYKLTIENSYYDSNKLSEIRTKIQLLNSLNNRLLNINSIIGLEQVNFGNIDVKNFIEPYREENIVLINDISMLKKQIANLENGNVIINALSNIIISKEGILKYRKSGYINCPLCGAEDKFESIKETDEVAIYAQNYINQTNKDIIELKTILGNKENQLNNNVEHIKNDIIKFLISIKDELIAEEKRFNYYNIKTMNIFSDIANLGIQLNSNCLNEVYKIDNELNTELKDINDIDKKTYIVENLLIAFNYEVDWNNNNLTANNLKHIKMGIELLIKERLEVQNFSVDLFNQKRIYINNLLNNYDLKEKEKKLILYKKNNNQIEKTRTEILMLIKSAKNRKQDIEKILANIEKNELKAVGPYIHNIFTKIIKHTKITNFKFNRDTAKKGGATFTDQYNNNILNILSQGQLSIFMLSYFFANIYKRQTETEFKSYFVDDITSFMDDMNILSFVDMIKYLLNENDTLVNQLFFSTCDDDLENLFIHKMKSFGLKWINYSFDTYGKGTIIDNSGSKPFHDLIHSEN